MTKILASKPIIDSVFPSLQMKCKNLTDQGLKPKLSVILVGDNPASLLYVKNKKLLCEKMGADFELVELAKDISEKEFLEEVNKLNDNPSVTGCFVQLPIPKHLAHINITQLINPKKDVDGFHLNTISKLYLNESDGLVPCTPKGIITLLQKSDIEITGKNVTIIGRSHIVGKPLSLLFNNLNATVTLCHSKTKDLSTHTKNADIIVSAIGIADFITSKHLREQKDQVIIDVGINKKDGKTVGDVAFEEVKDKVFAITPVPGGIGPMTVFSLMQNLLQTTENLLKE